jgi:CDP-diglyceride synthetase
VKSRFFVKDFVEKGCVCALSAPVFLVTVLVTFFGNGHETETGWACFLFPSGEAFFCDVFGTNSAD